MCAWDPLVTLLAFIFALYCSISLFLSVFPFFTLICYETSLPPLYVTVRVNNFLVPSRVFLEIQVLCFGLRTKDPIRLSHSQQGVIGLFSPLGILMFFCLNCSLLTVVLPECHAYQITFFLLA